MHLLPGYVVLLRTICLSRIEEQAPLVPMVVSDGNLQVKHFLVCDHYLKH